MYKMREYVICIILVLLVVILLPNPSFAYTTTRFSQTIASGNHVYVIWDDVSNGKSSVMFTQSNDSGISFGKTIKLADDAGIANQRKIVSSENNVYVAWDADIGNNHGIFLKKSTDYGNTFEPTIMLSDKNMLCNSVTGLQATGPYVYVFFNCYSSLFQEGSIVFRASHDNATSFGKPIVISQGKGIYSNIFLSTAAMGKNIYVVSEADYNISNSDDLLYRKSTDAGDTFSQAVILSNNKNSHVTPQVVLNKNYVYVIWRDYYDNSFKDLEFVKSNDYGKTFGNMIKLNINKPDTEMYYVPFLETNGDTVYVSWEEIHQGPVQTQYQLLRTSTDGGNTFGPEQKLTDVVPMYYHLEQDEIVLGSGQNVYFLYPGMANPTFDISGVFFKKSSDGAKTFGTTIDLNKLNSSPHDMYDPQVTVSGNNVYVTADTRDNGNDIFFVSSHDNGTTFGKVTNINNYDLVDVITKPSPLKQLYNGVASQNVKCQDGLELVINSQKSPACVRHVHLPRLLSNGWVYGINDIAQVASKKIQDILVVHDKIHEGDGLVPVTITEVINHAESLDSVMDWNFIPINYNGDNRGTTWDFIPQSYSLQSGVTDEKGNDVIDKSRMPENFGITAELRLYSAICSTTEKIRGEGGHPFSLPIKKGNPLVFVYSGGRGILPDSSGTYTVNFVSLFETKVEFPKSAHVISNQTQSCFLENKIDNFTKAFYTKAVFTMD